MTHAARHHDGFRRLLVLLLTVGFGATACVSSDPSGNTDPVPTSLTVSESTVNFSALGETAQLTTTVLDENGAVMGGVALTWSSSDEAVATVTTAGLVTAVAVGAATITASAGAAQGTSMVSVSQVAASIMFDSDPVVLAAGGDTITVVATVQDANDNAIVGETVTWSSADETVVLVSADGLVTAVAEGATLLTATHPDVTGEVSAFVGGARVVISDVSPSVLVEGEPATVFGLGFSADAGTNAVTIGGIAAVVTQATSTRLDITVPDGNCSPPRQAILEVQATGTGDTRSVDVTPPEVDVRTLVPGEAVFSTDGCVHLDAGMGSEEYLVGILSTSEAPSNLTPASLTSSTGAVVSTMTAAASFSASASRASAAESLRLDGISTGAASGPAPAALGQGSLTPVAMDHSGEALVRDAERRLLARLDLAALSQRVRGAEGPSLVPLRAVPNENDTLDVNVSSFADGDFCNTFADIQAVVRHVGAAGVWLEDTANPLSESFSLAEYQALDETLATSTIPTITSYFGDFDDVDDNQRILVVVTQEVNKVENLNGFAFSGDLVPATSCASSNGAEIFYGVAPDPSAVHGRTITKAQALERYPALIAHEATHVIQQTKRLFHGAAQNGRWAIEGGATLAEQLVGFAVLGDASGQDLGAAEWAIGEGAGWYGDWVYDLMRYFGYMGSAPRAVGAPEQCSWVGLASDGNTGPCENLRAAYGVPSTLLRLILDRYGADHPEGEAGLMREMTGSAFSGFENLEEATGETRVTLLTIFGITLWADGRPGGGDWLKSWNIFDIFQSLVPSTRLETYASSLAAPTLDVSVRAGSQSYLEWSPPASHDPTSLRIRTPAGDALESHMVLWVLRTQ